MDATKSEGFSKIATIDAISRPVEIFLERLHGSGNVADRLSPLDAYLLHLFLEFFPPPAAVIDLACGKTAGATTVVCLSNSHVDKVLAVMPDSSAAGTGRALREQVAGEHGRDLPRPALIVHESPQLREHVRLLDLRPQQFPVFLVEGSSLAADLSQTLDSIFQVWSRCVVLVLYMGKVGECPGLQSLAQACGTESLYRLWLLREVNSALHSSSLAVVAPRELAFVPTLIGRIERLFSTNYDFLQMVRDSAMYAVERGLAERMEAELQQLRTQVEEFPRIKMEAELQQLRTQVEEFPRIKMEAELQQLRVQVEEVPRIKSELQHRREEVSQLTQEAQRAHTDACVQVQEGERLRGHLLQEVNQLGTQLEIVQRQLHRECTRPVMKAIALQCGRRMVQFVRRNRTLLAPAGSMRERLARQLMRANRCVRGKFS